MDFHTLVKEARSCRRFHEEQRIGFDALQWLVDCARMAPSARNAQVLRFALAESKEACETVFPHTRWAGALKWDGPISGEQPTGYIAIIAPQKAGKLVHMDVGIAAQTIQLAGQSKGIGCCMHASFNPQALADFFAIPEDSEILLVLGLGIEKERRILTELPADGSIMYWRDEQLLHFVPKRELADLIFCCK